MGRKCIITPPTLKADTDGDGLKDGEEVLIYFTDPLERDCDFDGLLDGREVRAGRGPLDPNDYPLSNGEIAGIVVGSTIAALLLGGTITVVILQKKGKSIQLLNRLKNFLPKN